MSIKGKIQSASKQLLRHFVFFALWLLPLAGIGFWLFSLLNDILPWTTWHNFNVDLLYVLAAILWWGLGWVFYIVAQLLLPSLLLIFMDKARERNPKKIIQIGERFRKMQLTSPQIFVMKEKQPLWRNRIWGFFFMPSPMGALLLMDEAIAEQFTPEEYDIWMCRQVVQAKHFRFGSIGLQWWNLLPSLSLLGAGAGALVARLVQQPEQPAAALGLVLFLIMGMVLLKLLRTQREAMIDQQTLLNFEVTLDAYQTMQTKLLQLSPEPWWKFPWLGSNIEKRQELSQRKLWYRPWMPTGVAPALWSVLAIAVANTLPTTTVQEWNAQRTLLAKATAKPAIESKSEAVPAKVMPPPGSAVRLMTQAVQNGDLRLVIRALSHGEKVVDKDPTVDGATPLLLALRKGDLEMVYMLLSIGASLNQETDDNERDALFYALEAPNRQQVISYVLNAHLDFNHKAKDGLTAYDFAIKNGWTDEASLIAKVRERQGSAGNPE